MSKTLFTLAALGIVAAAPAFADPREPKPEPAMQSDAGATQAANPKTRYCIMVEPSTGSRITRRMCNTRDEWLLRGVDPLELKRR